MSLNKQFTAEVKALSPEEGGKPGEFSAIVAVYNNVDSAGDRIKSGAFDDTLAAWRKSGDPIPVVLAHEWNDPWAHIGYADPKDVESIPGRGLHVKRAVLDIDDNPVAKQVYRLMERRTLKEFSFGYKVPQGGEKKASDGAYDLLKLDLIEFGPCLKGVNSSTELLAVKSELEAAKRREKGEEPSFEERLLRLETAIAQLTKAQKPEEEDEVDGDKRLDDDGAPPADPPVDEGDEDDEDEQPETKSADIELMLRQQAIEALEVECAPALVKDHSLDDTSRTLDAYDRLLDA